MIRISFIRVNKSNHFYEALIPQVYKEKKPDLLVASTTGIKKNAVKILTSLSFEDRKKHRLSLSSSAKSAPLGELQSRYIIGVAKLL